MLRVFSPFPPPIYKIQISISTQNVIRYMISENCCGIASMSPLSGAKIARFIDDEEASAHLLADTALMCKAVSQFIQGAQHGDSADKYENVVSF